MKSDLSENDLASNHARMREERPAIKGRIDSYIDELLAVLARHDPLDIMASVALARQFGPAEAYIAGAHQDLPTSVDYLCSLATAQPFPVDPLPTTAEVIQKVCELLEDIRESIKNYFFTEAADGKRSIEESQIRFMILMRSMYVRGDAYAVVLRDIYLGLFRTSREFLEEHLGFTADEIVLCSDAIEAAVTARARQHLDMVTAAFSEWHGQLEAFLVSPGASKFSSRQEALETFAKEHPAEDFPGLQRLYEHCLRVGPKQMVEVLPMDVIRPKIIHEMSLQFGENSEFLTKVPSAKGWPLGPTLVHERPLVRHDGKYYCTDLSGLSWSLKTATEGMICRASPDYYEQSYLRARDSFLEARVADLLTQLFGQERVFRNLYYDVNDNQQRKRCELDVLATFGDSVILCECKAGGIRDAARRGALPSLISSMEDLIKNPCDQALRAKSYVQSNNVALFLNERGQPVTEIGRAKVHQFHLLTVTLEQLWFLSANLQSVKTLGVLDGETFPCAVSLADLIVMVEILDRPSLFLHYLHQRVRLSEAPNLMTFDELDLMMEYVEHELWTDPKKLSSEVHHVIGTQTPTLDAYYYAKEVGKVAPKPERKLHRGIASLLTAIERRPIDAATSCVCALLDCDEDTQAKIGSWVETGERQTRADGRPHSLSLAIDDGFALLLACDINPWSADRVQEWAGRWQSREGISAVYVIAWVVPLSSGIIRTLAFLPRAAIASVGDPYDPNTVLVPP